MTAIPSTVSIATIADGSNMVAADVRTPFSNIQTAINALIAILAAGSSGQTLISDGASAVHWASGGSVGAELDYKQITADVAGINATTEGTAQAVITGNSITYDGTRVKVEFAYPNLVASAGSPQPTFVLLRDAVVLGQVSAVGPAGAASSSGGVIFDTPAAGAHTYALKAFVSAGTLTVKAGAGGAGALVPAFLRVTKA